KIRTEQKPIGVLFDDPPYAEGISRNSPQAGNEKFVNSEADICNQIWKNVKQLSKTTRPDRGENPVRRVYQEFGMPFESGDEFICEARRVNAGIDVKTDWETVGS